MLRNFKSYCYSYLKHLVNLFLAMLKCYVAFQLLRDLIFTQFICSYLPWFGFTVGLTEEVISIQSHFLIFFFQSISIGKKILLALFNSLTNKASACSLTNTYMYMYISIFA